jgi:hypothetical protein
MRFGKFLSSHVHRINRVMIFMKRIHVMFNVDMMVKVIFFYLGCSTQSGGGYQCFEEHNCGTSHY